MQDSSLKKIIMLVEAVPETDESDKKITWLTLTNSLLETHIPIDFGYNPNFYEFPLLPSDFFIEVHIEL